MRTTFHRTPIALSAVEAFAAVKPSPSYILRREPDELFLKLTAIGFEERRVLGSRWLVATRPVAERYLVFEFPPQHFAELALATDKEIPLVFRRKWRAQPLAIVGMAPAPRMLIRGPLSKTATGESAFAKLKAHLRKSAERTVGGDWDAASALKVRRPRPQARRSIGVAKSPE